MTTKDLTLTDRDNETSFYIPMLQIFNEAKVSLTNLKIKCENFPKAKIFEACVPFAQTQLECETTDLIKEVESELKKAKNLMKDKYPIRTKVAFYKTILTNPLKFLAAKLWLRKLK